MKRLNTAQIIRLHQAIVEQTVGADSIRDLKLLESAVLAPFQSFCDTDLYPSITEKCTRLGYGLIKNHCFMDGNKRIGIHAMLVFCELNDIELSYTQTELVTMVLAVAAGEINFDDMYEWVEKHKK